MKNTKRSYNVRLGLLSWFLASLFYLYEYLARVAPSVMMAELQTAFNTDSFVIAKYSAIYYYIYAPMQLLVGVFYDRIGAKRLLVAATLLVALGCFLPEILPGSLWAYGLGRFLMGLGSSFGFVGAIYTATMWMPSGRIAFFSGLTTALGMLGAIMGETFLAAVVEELGWSQSWFQIGLWGLGLAGLIIFFMPRSPSWEVERRIAFAKTQGTFFLLSIFKSIFEVAKNPQIWYIGALGAALFLPLSLFGDLWAIQYIQKVCDVSKTKAGGVVAFLYLGWLIGSPIAGWLSDSMKRRKSPMVWGIVASTALLYVLIALPSVPYSVMAGALFLCGLLCSVEVVAFVFGVEVSSPNLKGTAVAVVNMVISLLGGVAQPISGYILSTRAEKRALEDYIFGNELVNTITDYQMAMMVLPTIMLFGFFAAFFIKESYTKRVQSSN